MTKDAIVVGPYVKNQKISGAKGRLGMGVPSHHIPPCLETVDSPHVILQAERQWTTLGFFSDHPLATVVGSVLTG